MKLWNTISLILALCVLAGAGWYIWHTKDKKYTAIEMEVALKAQAAANKMKAQMAYETILEVIRRGEEEQEKNTRKLTDKTGVVVQENVEGKPYTTEYALHVPKDGKKYDPKDKDTFELLHLVVGHEGTNAFVELDSQMNAVSIGGKTVTLRGFSGQRNFKSYFIVFEIKKNETHKHGPDPGH